MAYGAGRFAPAIGGDAGHKRYSPLDQITAENFEDLEIAWVWRGDNFGPDPLATSRSTPIYVDGTLYTVVGDRRTVVAIDPGTGFQTTVSNGGILQDVGGLARADTGLLIATGNIFGGSPSGPIIADPAPTKQCHSRHRRHHEWRRAYHCPEHGGHDQMRNQERIL